MSEKSKRPTRRKFLRQASFAVAALGPATHAAAQTQKSIKPGVSARSAARVIGANDRINVGMIGMGGMGTVHLRAFMSQSEEDKDIQVIALSDIYTVRKENARNIAKLTDEDVHHDYRDLLARSDVDAVLIAVPDHWHGQIALDALTAGKDVYLEKPMTHTIDEARQVAEATKKHSRILQVGAHGMSSAGAQKARELIEQGEIGELLWAQATSARNSTAGEWNYRIEPEGTPQTIDWKRWLGPAPSRPFSAERYFRFRKYWDYSGGIATDLFYHVVAPLNICWSEPQFPTKVAAFGGIYVFKDEREVPDTFQMVADYKGHELVLSSSMANSRHIPGLIRGHEGTIVMVEHGMFEGETDHITVIPEKRVMSDAYKAKFGADE